MLHPVLATAKWRGRRGIIFEYLKVYQTQQSSDVRAAEKNSVACLHFHLVSYLVLCFGLGLWIFLLYFCFVCFVFVFCSNVIILTHGYILLRKTEVWFLVAISILMKHE